MALGIYVHVPFCASRCGYCDFNTYTAVELGGGADQAQYADLAVKELDLAAEQLGNRTVDTVFFGGGTPTLLDTGDLELILTAIRQRFSTTPQCEVTTEANPESVTAQSLAELRDAGFNRISFGMQSAVPRVLAVLERTHQPDRVPDVVEWARAAGFDSISLDLIYGTPGESLDDWRTSLDTALSLQPDHVSAYSLIVEPGTRLARNVASGQYAAPDDDDLADKYLLADERLSSAGFQWYEVSNWAVSTDQQCLHNMGYWNGDDWWGVGPGAHSHLAGRRWWNVKHPRAYAGRLLANESPMAEQELLTAAQQHDEHVMLHLRLSQGLDVGVLSAAARPEVERLLDQGLLERQGSSVRPTRQGRLLADSVVRRLLVAENPDD